VRAVANDARAAPTPSGNHGRCHSVSTHGFRRGGSGQTRRDILEATARLLNRHPFGAVSTSHIATRTGISIGTLYQYYPNKDVILADLLLDLMQHDAALLGRIFEDSAQPGRTNRHDSALR
jgi:AcrR family transcriptional regulator